MSTCNILSIKNWKNEKTPTTLVIVDIVGIKALDNLLLDIFCFATGENI